MFLHKINYVINYFQDKIQNALRHTGFLHIRKLYHLQNRKSALDLKSHAHEGFRANAQFFLITMFL